MTRCCKRNKERTCSPCHTTQEWESQLPPVEIIQRDNTAKGYSILTTGDSDYTGNSGCIGVNAEHSHIITYDSYLSIAENTDTDGRTSLTDQIPTRRDETPKRQLINSGKLYSRPIVTPVSDLGSGRGVGGGLPAVYNYPADMFGQFYSPPSSFLDGVFKKFIDFAFGADHYGRTLDAQWSYGEGDYGDFTLATLNTNFIGISIKVVDSEKQNIGDRSVFVNGADSGLKFWQFLANGLSLRVTHDLIEITSQSPTEFQIVIENTIENLATGQVLKTEQDTFTIPRCFTAQVNCHTFNRWQNGELKYPNDIAGSFGEEPFVCSPVDLIWFDSIINKQKTDDQWPGILLGWINKLKVSNSLSDTATFRCVSFKGYRSDGSLFKEVYPDTDEFSLTHNQIVDVDAMVGDEYIVAFDNMGDHTTELTGVTFDTPLVSSVDRATESFAAYEFNSFTFAGPSVGGGVCSPASSASISPSTFVLQSDSPDIVAPSDSFGMTYNGTANKWAMVGSNNITFNSYNGNTAYTCKCVLQVIRGGDNVANLSHDISDSIETDSDAGSTVDDASMTLDNDVISLSLTNPGSDTTASIMDPNPYVPEFGDTVRLTLTLTGNSDSIDYVRTWESSIDCTAGFGSGAQTSNLTFTHDQSGNDIVSPFTLQLRSINGIQE